MDISNEDRRKLAAHRTARFFDVFPFLRQAILCQSEDAVVIHCNDRPTADRAVAEFDRIRNQTFVILGVSRVSVRLGYDVLADALISFAP